MRAAATPAATRPRPPVARDARADGAGILVTALAAACVLTFAFRASLPVYLYPRLLIEPFFVATIGSLVATAAWSLIAGLPRLRFTVLVLMACAAASLLNCDDREFAGERLVGWSILLLTVGPLNASDAARRLRSRAHVIALGMVIAVTVASAAWYVLGLPELGRGGFTGVMWHSMTLGPLAAICGVLALSKAFSTARMEWGGLYVVALTVCVLSASRSALAALGFATIVILAFQIRRNAVIALGSIAITSVLVFAPGVVLSAARAVMPGEVTQGLEQKGWNHSREAHWEARWDEFNYSPVTGVGFSYGWLDTAGVNEDLSSVEAGSSYIAVLSMTGLVGAGGCMLLALTVALRFWRHAKKFSYAARMEIASMAGFWFVHLGAEGYIFAVGSLMGMIFWLWLARVIDALDSAALAGVARPAPRILDAISKPRWEVQHAA